MSKRERSTQASYSEPMKKIQTLDKSTQCGSSQQNFSYHRQHQTIAGTYRWLLSEVIPNREQAIQWSMDKNLIPKSRLCHKCQLPMHLSSTTKCSDGVIWRCQRKGHSAEKSIRAGSWFDKSNLTITELLELTYLWSTGNCNLLFDIFVLIALLFLDLTRLLLE